MDPEHRTGSVDVRRTHHGKAQIFTLGDRIEFEIGMELDSRQGFKNDAGLSPEFRERIALKLTLKNFSTDHFNLDKRFAEQYVTAANTGYPVRPRWPAHQFINYRIIRESFER